MSRMPTNPDSRDPGLRDRERDAAPPSPGPSRLRASTLIWLRRFWDVSTGPGDADSGASVSQTANVSLCAKLCGGGL